MFAFPTTVFHNTPHLVALVTVVQYTRSVTGRGHTGDVRGNFTVTKLINISRDYMVFYKPYFKAHNLVSVHPKSIILGQMTNLNMIFHVVVSVYRFVKI